MKMRLVLATMTGEGGGELSISSRSSSTFLICEVDNEEKDEIMEEGAAKWSIRFKRSNESLSETLYLVYGHETRHFREVSSVQNTDVRWVDRY